MRHAREMQVTYDPEADAAYIALSSTRTGRIVWNPEVVTSVGSVILDIDVNGKLLGVEVLAASVTLDPDVLARAVQLEP